jgi:hypothetical protein
MDDSQFAGIMEEVKHRNLMLRNHNSGNFFSDAIQTIRTACEEEVDRCDLDINDEDQLNQPTYQFETKLMPLETECDEEVMFLPEESKATFSVTSVVSNAREQSILKRFGCCYPWNSREVTS